MTSPQTSPHMFLVPPPRNPVYYTLASGTLLVINKVAIVALPAPSFVLLLQLLASAGAVLAAHGVGAVTITPATSRQLLHFLPVTIGFLGTIYANIKVLQHSNVDTFITFRSSTPLVLAFCDWAFLGRQLPCGRSWSSLGLLLLSSAGYAYFDKGFVMDAYLWLFIWYVFFTFEGVWVKHMCDTVPMGNWARVYYANLMSAPFLAVVLFFDTSEQDLLAETEWTFNIIAPIALSCAVGVAMSHASYLLRSHAAATTAAVVGIVCKLLSVTLNLVIWDKHAGPVQLGFLLMGIFAASIYRRVQRGLQALRQAPLRQPPKVSDYGGVVAAKEAAAS
ncbi:solute carrier protein [Monoraphidium neglectum]|uniref:Solute carrier protein n=1 Tax=Monoraphidium neglectum TaxID=145388 RepID=A0A0D2MN19_9CHLO|nr:solute carrier protein [Monoraphidium neglectum]KIY96130.1 solute carrier protein [Monoraphidium neglectum]|eukprot:XP_013895150.1 solute carrier protein [Monoraphidium neglectum]